MVGELAVMLAGGAQRRSQTVHDVDRHVQCGRALVDGAADATSDVPRRKGREAKAAIGIEPLGCEQQSLVAGLDHVRHVDERVGRERSEEHTSELQSLMRISYAVFCLKKNNIIKRT